MSRATNRTASDCGGQNSSMFPLVYLWLARSSPSDQGWLFLFSALIQTTRLARAERSIAGCGALTTASGPLHWSLARIPRLIGRRQLAVLCGDSAQARLRHRYHTVVSDRHDVAPSRPAPVSWCRPIGAATAGSLVGTIRRLMAPHPKGRVRVFANHGTVLAYYLRGNHAAQRAQRTFVRPRGPGRMV